MYKSKHPLYKTYRTMIDRCHRPSSSGFASYGARGITVCDRWRRDFWAFALDMGPKPGPEYSIERVDNHMGYGPANCIWATSWVQSRNRSTTRVITIGDRTMCATDWADEFGVAADPYLMRLVRGWDPIMAAYIPIGYRISKPVPLTSQAIDILSHYVTDEAEAAYVVQVSAKSDEVREISIEIDDLAQTVSGMFKKIEFLRGRLAEVHPR